MAKLAIVTGGANGIGRGIVRRLAADGYGVLFCDVDVAGGQQLADDLSAAHPSVRYAPCDVSNPDDVARLAEVAADSDAPVYAVVNNAGIFPRSEFLTMSLEEWQRVLAVNLTGQFLVSRAFVPSMIDAGDGVIVNLTSGVGFRGDPLGAHYAASKHGVRGLTKSLAIALGPSGIRVNAIAPGVTDTAQAGHTKTREQLHERGRELPLGRIGQPEDIAAAVAFLLGPDARYMTGQTLLVNGGQDMP